MQVRVRLGPEERQHILEIERQQQHARDGDHRAEPPAAARDREPDPEADHHDHGVLAAGQGQRERDRAPRVAASIERERRGDDQGDRERLGMDVADVDPVERRIDQEEQREAAGGRHRAEPARRVSKHRQAARRQHEGLHDEQSDRPRRDAAERHHEIEHGREVIAPGVHRRERHVRAAAGGDTPDDLHVIAEIEGVGPQRQVPGDHDEPHHEGVNDGAQDRHRRGRHRGQPERSRQRAERHDHGKRDDELVGAGERVTGDGQRAPRDHHHQEQSDTRGDRLEEAGRARHGRRVYLARRLSKRRERRRPRWFKVNQKSTERIRTP